MKFALASLSGFVSASINDDAVLLSVSSARESLGADSSLTSLIDFARESSPRKAQQLLQQFAKNTLVRMEAVDEVTKNKLKEIGAQLTNNTWMALEQAHRRDQDLIDKHWRAIKQCGDKHIAHLQQDIDGFEVQQVRTYETDMIKCRGLPNHTRTDTEAEKAKLRTSRDEWATSAYNPSYDGSANLLQMQNPKDNGHVISDATKEWAERVGGKQLYEHLNKDLTGYDTTAWLADTPFAIYKKKNNVTGKIEYQRHFEHVSARYNIESSADYYLTGSLLALKNELCDVCGELDDYLNGDGGMRAYAPNCQPDYVYKAEDPKCTTADLPAITTDLDQWFNNLINYAERELAKWEKLNKACKDAREAYVDKDQVCDEEQKQYEEGFCQYRQGLHSTCAEYQGCHILNEEQFMALVTDAQFAADSRKIDWKAIHKIACYIKVLISDGTNQERTLALENCESGNLNTLATILTGFNETNYLSIIIPEISGNVSCWDMVIPPLIDFKECDMSAVHQYPCTPTWMQRYEGLESPAQCTHCSPLPSDSQYSDNDYQNTEHYRESNYGGGWIFVNEMGRSVLDINDLTEIQPDGYHLPSYQMGNLRYNEVLVKRMSANWCDSWGRQTGKWVEDNGASMCVQADHDHVYCMSNHNDEHTWRQQPTTHFAALCGEGKPNVGDCECWPYAEGATREDRMQTVCFAHTLDSPKARENKLAPRHVMIHSMEDDGSVVKISFHGEEKKGVLRVGNYGSFLDGVGCGAVTPVKYRVFVRCLGCLTERTDFHTKDGAQFNSVMEMGELPVVERDFYTYEAWFRSPLLGDFPREIFGGVTAGMALSWDVRGACAQYGDGSSEETQYTLHLGGTNVYSTTCFRKDMMYHLAVTKHPDHGIIVYVNGVDVTFTDPQGVLTRSHLLRTFGGGFTDGGQLFNVRIWDYARSVTDLLAESAVTEKEKMSSLTGLAHWWPLTDGVQDVITGAPLTGPEVRYAPIWCSDLEATGMRVC